ncbi:hypothetical protein ABEH87_13535 [Erwinia sp. Eh17-17]
MAQPRRKPAGGGRFANYSDTQTRHTPPEAVVVVVVAVRNS